MIITTSYKILGIIVGVALLAFVIFITNERTPNNNFPVTDSPEAGFARDMSIHHQQAVEMSFLIRERTDNQDIRNFAYDIINTQATQRGMMLGWLSHWQLDLTSDTEPMAWMIGEGHSAMDMSVMADFTPGAFMPGMATREEMNALRATTGAPAEKLFLELMIRHHQGGVIMAKGIVKLSDHTEMVRLAQTMVEGQQSEIDYMQDQIEKYTSF